MKNGIALALLLALGVGCGGGEEAATEAPPETAAAPTAAEAPAAEEAPAAAEEAPAAAAQPAAAAGGSNFGTVSLAPGFMPDPSKATGTSGGSIDASTLDQNCNGWVAGTPDHLFVAQGDFSNLRVMVQSESDTTLVIQRPDGSYVCNDDGENLDPIVASNFAAGTYKVWVGSYMQGENSPYTLGLSELGSVMPSSL